MSLPETKKTSSNSERTFVLHGPQQQGWAALDESGVREIAMCAGIQSGKTTFGSLATMKKVKECREKFGPCNFLVTADTYKTLHQATIPTALKIFRKLGKYKAGDSEIALKGGGTIFFRTGTDPWSVEGIPDVAFAWMDEAGKCSRLFQINVLGRVARLQGQVLYTSTPYAMNWYHHDVEKPCLNGSRQDIRFIRFSSMDNPSFPKEEFERQRQQLDARIFRMKYMGMHERMQGLVYPGAHELVTEDFVWTPKTKVFAGVDFGFAEGHEFALVIRAIQEDGRVIDFDEFKSAGLDPTEQVSICLAKQKTYNIQSFFCDPARPDLIALMNKNGLRAQGFHIGREAYKQIVPGIQAHTTLMKSGKYLIHKRCQHLLDEYETYHWPENQEDKEAKEVPVAINDHCLDAARYCTIGTMHVEIKKESVYTPRKFLKRDFFDPRKKTKSNKSWDAY